MYVPPKNDPEYSWMRLNGILGRRRLSFNPYTVSDYRLLEIARTTGWGNDFDITQILILNFIRLHETGNYRRFDGIFVTVGESQQEIFIPTATLAYGVTANDTVRNERFLLGKKSLCRDEHVADLVGKTVFVSRIIRGTDIFGRPKGAYRMHKLFGHVRKDAKTIRQAMVQAKIEMLERILAYPQSPDYLSCAKGLIDYEPPLRQAIDLIRHYPETPVPDSAE